MKVDGQSYDGMRYELGVKMQVMPSLTANRALTPYFKLKTRLRRLQQRC